MLIIEIVHNFRYPCTIKNNKYFWKGEKRRGTSIYKATKRTDLRIPATSNGL